MSLKRKKQNLKYIFAFIILFAIEVFIAFFIHDDFIRPYIGDVLVTILVYCFLRIFIVHPVKLLPLYVFLFASCVEVSQYFNIAKVLGLQDNRIAEIILGSVFDMNDILCYLAGCILLLIYQESAPHFTAKHKLTEE